MKERKEERKKEERKKEIKNKEGRRERKKERRRRNKGKVVHVRGGVGHINRRDGGGGVEVT